MEIPVLIEPVTGNGYRARGSEPFGLIAEGATAEEALQKLRALIADRVGAGGGQIVPLELPTRTEPPWTRFAGTLRDDPLFEPWQQAMAEYRRQMDEDPDVP